MPTPERSSSPPGALQSLASYAQAPAEDATPDPLVGSVLAGYTVKARIGAGGMGVVYRAARPGGADVAIKVLPETLMSDPVRRARFRREAEAARRIDDPRVVRTLEYHEDAGRGLLVQELVLGASLDRVLTEGRRPTLDATLDMGVAVAKALEAAHRAGLVHRDVKPGNIMVTPGGAVKMLDFGLAKDLDDDAAPLSVAGTILGTPHYASPEQAKGTDPIDHRSDLYSLGVVLFELATGARPFHAKTFTAVLVQHATLEPPRPREVNPAVPEELEALILELLEKSPDARPQTAAEVGDRLAAIAAGAPTIAPASSRASTGTGDAVPGAAAAAAEAPDAEAPNGDGRDDGPPPLYRNWLSRRFAGSRMTFATLLVVAGVSGGIYGASEPLMFMPPATLVAPMIVLALAALFSRGFLPVFIAAALPIPAVLAGFCLAVPVEVNTTDFEVVSLLLAGASLVCGTVLYALTRWNRSRGLSLLVAFGMIGMTLTLATEPEMHPYARIQYDVYMNSGRRALARGDLHGARWDFELAQYHDRAVWSLDRNDWRLELAKVARTQGDTEEVVRLLRDMLASKARRINFDLTYEHRAFAIDTLAESDPELAAQFLPEEGVEQMSIGWSFRDEQLAELYERLYTAMQEQRMPNRARALHDRGCANSPTYAERHHAPLSPERPR